MIRAILGASPIRFANRCCASPAARWPTAMITTPSPPGATRISPSCAAICPIATAFPADAGADYLLAVEANQPIDADVGYDKGHDASSDEA